MFEEYRRQEEGIPQERKFVVKEGFNNPCREIGVIAIKEKSSDDGTKSLKGTYLVVSFNFVQFVA